MTSRIPEAAAGPQDPADVVRDLYRQHAVALVRLALLRYYAGLADTEIAAGAGDPPFTWPALMTSKPASPAGHQHADGFRCTEVSPPRSDLDRVAGPYPC